MSFNNGNERRKLNAKWEQLRVQYREAGMSEEAIQAMYEFDLGVLNSERAYDASTVAVCDGEDDVDARKAADLKQYEAAITVTDTYHETRAALDGSAKSRMSGCWLLLKAYRNLISKSLRSMSMPGTPSSRLQVPWNPKGLRFISESSE